MSYDQNLKYFKNTSLNIEITPDKIYECLTTVLKKNNHIESRNSAINMLSAILFFIKDDFIILDLLRSVLLLNEENMYTDRHIDDNICKDVKYAIDFSVICFCKKVKNPLIAFLWFKNDFGMFLSKTFADDMITVDDIRFLDPENKNNLFYETIISYMVLFDVQIKKLNTLLDCCNKNTLSNIYDYIVKNLSKLLKGTSVIKSHFMTFFSENLYMFYDITDEQANNTKDAINNCLQLKSFDFRLMFFCLEKLFLCKKENVDEYIKAILNQRQIDHFMARCLLDISTEKELIFCLIGKKNIKAAIDLTKEKKYSNFSDVVVLL